MSKALIERLREAAAQRVASTAMIGADDMIAAADALESLDAAYGGAVEAGKSLAKQAFKAEQERDALVLRVSELTCQIDRAEEAMVERDALTAELKALREREPVAWMNEDRDMTYLGHYHPKDIPLYTHPIPARELTDEEILNALDAKVETQFLTMPVTCKELWLTAGSVDVREFVRAIEAAMRGEDNV